MSADPSSSAPGLSQRFALDVQGFASLRAQAAKAPQQAVKTAAQQFDAVFIQMMLKSMRDATPSDGPLDSNETTSFTSMLDEQMSQQMSTKGIGVADAMLKQLMNNAGGQTGTSGAGKDAMMSALSKAYANASANGALATDKGYGAHSALVPAVRGNGPSPKVDAFVDKLAEPAQAASSATGIPARFILGQAALESDWGEREIKQADGTPSHNVFGIKATRDWTGKTVATATTEYVDGQPKQVVQKFRAYDSYEQAMTDYANVMTNNPRYASVLSSSQDAAGFANSMQRAGYATDPHYASKLMSIMQHM